MQYSKAQTGKFTVQFPVRARNHLFPENVKIGSWNQQTLTQWVKCVLSQGVKRLGCHPQLVQMLGMSTALPLPLCASTASTHTTSPLLFMMCVIHHDIFITVFGLGWHYALLRSNVEMQNKVNKQ